MKPRVRPYCCGDVNASAGMKSGFVFAGSEKMTVRARRRYMVVGLLSCWVVSAPNNSITQQPNNHSLHAAAGSERARRVHAELFAGVQFVAAAEIVQLEE